MEFTPKLPWENFNILTPICAHISQWTESIPCHNTQRLQSTLLWKVCKNHCVQVSIVANATGTLLCLRTMSLFFFFPVSVSGRVLFESEQKESYMGNCKMLMVKICWVRLQNKTSGDKHYLWSKSQSKSVWVQFSQDIQFPEWIEKIRIKTGLLSWPGGYHIFTALDESFFFPMIKLHFTMYI